MSLMVSNIRLPFDIIFYQYPLISDAVAFCFVAIFL